MNSAAIQFNSLSTQSGLSANFEEDREEQKIACDLYNWDAKVVQEIKARSPWYQARGSWRRNGLAIAEPAALAFDSPPRYSVDTRIGWDEDSSLDSIVFVLRTTWNEKSRDTGNIRSMTTVSSCCTLVRLMHAEASSWVLPLSQLVVWSSIFDFLCSLEGRYRHCMLATVNGYVLHVLIVSIVCICALEFFRIAWRNTSFRLAPDSSNLERPPGSFERRRRKEGIFLSFATKLGRPSDPRRSSATLAAPGRRWPSAVVFHGP